jgi:hypothetical protein
LLACLVMVVVAGVVVVAVVVVMVEGGRRIDVGCVVAAPLPPPSVHLRVRRRKPLPQRSQSRTCAILLLDTTQSVVHGGVFVGGVLGQEGDAILQKRWTS